MGLKTKNGSSQGQNLALTGIFSSKLAPSRALPGRVRAPDHRGQAPIPGAPTAPSETYDIHNKDIFVMYVISLVL